MSMAHFSWPLLYFLSFYPQLGLAGQPFTGFLSSSIAQVIPTCAQDCIASFITENYPNSTCPQRDLDCLCKINSVSGFTLGEGGLRCVVSACSLGTNTTDNRVAAYYICSNTNGAKSMTHGTITATAYPRRISLATPDIPELSQSPMTSQSRTTSSSLLPSTTTLSSSTTTSLPSLTRDTLFSTITPTTPASGSSPLPPINFTSSSTSIITPITFDSGSPPFRPHTSTSSSSSRSRSTSSASGTSRTPTATAIAVAAKPILSKPQIAGVTVAAVVTLLAVGALIFFLFCFRRRRNSSDHGSSRCSSFGDNKTYASHPSSPGPYHPIGGNAEHGNRSRDIARDAGPGNPRIVEGTPASYWRRSPVRAEEIGVALGSPAMMQAPVADEAPKSGKSHRTISQLLPDKPIYSLYPAPLRVKHLNTSTSPIGAVVPGEAGIGQRSATPLSKPAPLGNKSSDIGPASLHRNFSNLRPSASDPFLDSRFSHSVSTYSRQGRRRGEPRDSIRDLPHREVLNYGQWNQSLDSLQKPVPARQSSSARTLNQQKAAYDSISSENYIGTSELGPPTQPGRQLSIPRKPVPRQPPPRRIRRPLTRYSSASETSFEDAGDDDDMPRSQAFLSPVTESYARRSSRGHDGPPGPPVSVYSRYQRLEPVSPTPKSSQRRQPSPLITPATDPKLLKNMLKPLPEVPESDISDSSMPLMGKRRANTRVPHGPRPNPNESPRGETELTKSAKWKILVSPGLQGLEDMGAPRSGRSNEWGYNTPITGRAPK